MNNDLLESLDDTKSFLDGTANGKVVDGGSTKSTVTVNDESATKGDALLGEENVVGLGHGVVAVSELGE